MSIRKITPDDAEYPKNLRNIYNPPKQLYVNGTLLESDETAVAVVGSRRASIYGLETGEKLGFELAARGVTVVSGMAVGIDSAAHRGALKAKGRTIAVMGSGHNVIYPPKNKKLYGEITKSGAVVTEYEDNIEPLAWNFPARNRIISGLSLGIVVVEAAKNSGALITANFAAEQGRTVFAVPGKVSSSTSSGTNELIRDGACLIQSVDDILQELSLTPSIEPAEGVKKDKIDRSIESKTKAYIYNSLTEDERKVYKILSDEPLYIDDIFDKTGFGSAKGSKVLLNLELKKLIAELPGKNFVRKES
ncbi:MAG: DNA-processing protein DprA [Candidatus Omnitrophica bacterium]|nr:DNA-processing protein DprA [Candidatus Omnitrophota bacterium]